MRRLALLAVPLVLALAVAATVVTRGGGAEPEAEAAAEPTVDLSTTKGRDAPWLRTFDPSVLVKGAGIDQIPAIDEPKFDSPEKASELLQDTDLVVGVEIGGDARAYPTNLLSLHEVVNDEVGGVPVVITWCPLCTTALAFDRRAGGETLTFGVSGFLYSRNLMLFDRQTGSLWSQLLGGAVTGERRGTKLRGVPIVHQTWETWRAAHPDTRVLSFERDDLAVRFTDPGVEQTGFGEEATDAPFGGYATKVPYYYREKQGRLAGATRVYGIVVNGRAKAYPLTTLRARGTIRDRVNGVPVVVRYDDDAFSATTSARGDLIPGTFAYWFAWRAIHPETLVHDGGRAPDSDLE